jgi:hypothetical protein
MAAIKLPETLARKIDVNVAQEIANESLRKIHAGETKVVNLPEVLDDLDIPLDETLLNIDSIAKNAKDASVRLAASRTILELRGHLGRRDSADINNNICVVIQDKEAKQQGYTEIFYPEEVKGRVIAEIDEKRKSKELTNA